MFGSGLGFSGDGGSNGAISGSKKSKMAAAAILEKFQMAISPQPVVRSTSCFVLRRCFRHGGSNGTISDNYMYGQFTCLRRQHHSRSLLMRKTSELDFVWEGRLYSLEAGNKIAAFNWDNLRIANNALSSFLVLM